MIHKQLVLLAMLLFALGACGQKGPLIVEEDILLDAEGNPIETGVDLDNAIETSEITK